MSKPDLEELKRNAEAQAAAYERMVELDGGIGLLGVRHPEMFEDMMVWSEASQNEHADTVLRLIAYIEQLETQIERVRELHQRVETRSHYPMPPNWEHQKLVVCGYCKHAGDAAHPYPCPTIEALGGTSE